MTPAIVSLRINLEELKNELRTLPGLAQQIGNEIGEGIGKGMDKAERAAKRGKQAAFEWEKGLKSLEASGRVTGGMFGDMTGIAGDLADTFGVLGGVTGGLTAGFAAAALAVGAGYVALDALAESAARANDRLGELDGSEGPSLAAAAALDEWRQGSVQVEAATAELTVALAEHLLPAFVGVKGSLAELLRDTTEFVEAVGPAIQATQEWAQWWGRIGIAISTLGLSEQIIALRHYAGATEEVRVEVHDLGGTIAALTEEEEEALYQLGFLVDETRELRDAEEEAQTAIREGARQQAIADAATRSRLEALRELRREQEAQAKATASALAAEIEGEERAAEMLAELNGDRITAQEEIYLAYDRRHEQIEALAIDEEEKAALRAENELRLQRDLLEAKSEADKDAAAAKAKLDKKALEAEERRREATLETLDAVGRNIDAFGDLTGALQDFAKEGSAAHTALFAVHQGAALASVAVDTAAAIMRAFAEYGPPPSPVGIMSAAAAATAGTAAAATIIGQTINKQHSGSSGVAPDEAVILKSEGTLSHLGVQALGGHAEIAEVNAGKSPWRRADSSVGVFAIGHRVVGESLGRSARVPNHITQRLARAGKRVGRRRIRGINKFPE